MSMVRELMPVPDVPGGLRFPEVTRSEPSPGLRLWSVEKRNLPIVHLLWLWHAGTASDALDAPGLAALTADMLDEGTVELDMPALHEALARIGGQLDADIGHDATVLSLTTLSAHRDRAVALLAAMAQTPRFDAADLDRVRALRLTRLRQLRHSPSALADLVTMAHLYRDHAYGRSGLGTERTLQSLDEAAVRAQHARVLQAPVTLIAVGDISHDEFERLVLAHLDTGPRHATVTEYGGLTVPASRLLFVPREGAAQSELRVGRVAEARATADYHGLVVANTLLGGAFVSRINTKLREEKGVTYGARSGFQFLRQPGPFVVQCSVQSDATSASIQDILTELDDLGGSRPVTADELDSARDALTRGYARGFETVQQVARSAAQLALYDLPHDTYDHFVERVTAVTAADVSRLARRWLRPDDMHAVVVGDRGTATQGFEGLSLGQPAERLPDDILQV